MVGVAAAAADGCPELARVIANLEGEKSVNKPVFGNDLENGRSPGERGVWLSVELEETAV